MPATMMTGSGTRSRRALRGGALRSHWRGAATDDDAPQPTAPGENCGKALAAAGRQHPRERFSNLPIEDRGLRPIAAWLAAASVCKRADSSGAAASSGNTRGSFASAL
jgi:hypothetical protein